MKESTRHDWGSWRCTFWLLLMLGASYPQMVSGASGTPSGALELPKIDAPPSMSPKAQAKLEKELSDCRSQSSSLAEKTKALESAATVSGKAEAECKQLQESKAALEKQLAEEKSRLKESEKKAAAAEAAAKQTGEATASLEKQLAAEQAARAEAEKKLAARPSPPLPATVSGASSSATLSQAGVPPPDSSYTDPTTGMEFVWVPGGEFQIGDTFGDGGSDDDKPPSHQTRIAGFWMGKYEVTQGEWVKVMGKNPSKFQKGDRYPVEQVSWDMAQDFITKLNKPGKPQYRLPSEAEWEYAASVRRDGQKVKYGTETGDLSRKLANYGTESCCNGDSSDGYEHTAPVGSYHANDRGLYDMSGNVWEWVQDCWHGSYAGSPSDGTSWEKNCDSSIRVNRGGGWSNRPWFGRAAYRYGFTPDSADDSRGFRLVLPSSASGK